MHISVPGDAAPQSNGIAFDVPADRRVVVAPCVVRDVCLLVGVLPREPQRKLERPEARRVLIGHIDAEGLVLIPAPYRPLILIGDESWRVEMTGVTSCTDESLSYR